MRYYSRDEINARMLAARVKNGWIAMLFRAGTDLNGWFSLPRQISNVSVFANV
jgi:hypothetical protein